MSDTYKEHMAQLLLPLVLLIVLLKITTWHYFKTSLQFSLFLPLLYPDIVKHRMCIKARNICDNKHVLLACAHTHSHTQ